MRHSIIVFAVLVGFCALPAHPQNTAGDTVYAVDIQGLERISEQTVRAKLEVQPGQTFHPRAVARDIRRLYEMGFFDVIRAEAAQEAQGIRLIYRVEEKQVIDSIRIMGNKWVHARRIRSVLTMREGQSFAPDACNEEIDAILNLYESRGFANATVDLAVEKVGPSRVRLVYMIQENRKARISKIAFEGNEEVKDRVLRRVMKTRRAFWFLGGKFQEDRFETDLSNILDEYGNRGHLEARIPHTEISYGKKGKRMYITVHLAEGPVYHVESLRTANNFVYDTDEILNILQVHEGDVHNKGQVVRDAELATKGYQDSGYVNAIVTPQVTLDREKKTTHIVHNVSEGELKYVREIKITGNEVTKDETIRREMLLRPGDRYDGALLQASQRRLENTQFFRQVRLTLADIEDHDIFTDLMVDVEEGKTGTFNFGAGYSTDEGVGGFAELRLNNFDIANPPRFHGAGQELRMKLHVGDIRSNYALSFTDPEFLGYPFSMGFDVFNDSYRVRGGANYTEEQLGGQLRFGKQLSPLMTLRGRLRIAEETNRGLPSFGHPALRSQSGSFLNVSTGWEIERNTLDNRRDPSKGAVHIFSTELAGFGGDYQYAKVEHDSTWYRAFGGKERWVLSARIREGMVTAYGGEDTVPLQARLYAGGAATVRGYKIRDIGPKAREYILFGDKFALGGNINAITNLEMKYKITKMLRLYGFFDAGGVWEYFKDIDPADIRCSLGLGFGVDVPRLGPIRVDYGFPLNPDKDQGSGRLHLMTGFRF